MAPTLRRDSWMPVLLLLGGAVGIAAMLDLAVGSLTWWLALAGFLALGLTLGRIGRQRQRAAPPPAPDRPPLWLIDGGKARLEREVGDLPAEPGETQRWLM